RQQLTPAQKERAAKAKQFQTAMEKLLAQHDPEVIQLMKDSAKDPQHTPMTEALMEHLIQKAGLAQSTTQPTTQKLAAVPTTQKLAEAPATQPTTRPALAAAKEHPTTAPATQTLAHGIPANMRPMIAAQIKRSLMSQFPGAKVTDEMVNRIMDRSS